MEKVGYPHAVNALEIEIEIEIVNTRKLAQRLSSCVTKCDIFGAMCVSSWDNQCVEWISPRINTIAACDAAGPH